MEKPNGHFHKELVTLNNSVDIWKQQGSFDGFLFRLLIFEILPLSLTANLCYPAKTFYIQKKDFQPHDLSEKNAVNCFHSAHHVNVKCDRLVAKCESFCHRFFISSKKSGLECLEWDFKAVSSSCFISCQKLSHFSEIVATSHPQPLESGFKWMLQRGIQSVVEVDWNVSYSKHPQRPGSVFR